MRYTLFLFTLLLLTPPSFAQESTINKVVCVEKNILLQGHFTVKIRPKKENCEKYEEEMNYERKKDGTILLFPLSPTSEEKLKEKEPIL
ncbi:MAG: hypothetical protein HQM15_10310 [Deltaproteobacteria bacterium]|nr:hypothetical protein [Deltaproteobacteria bacterium]